MSEREDHFDRAQKESSDSAKATARSAPAKDDFTDSLIRGFFAGVVLGSVLYLVFYIASAGWHDGVS